MDWWPHVRFRPLAQAHWAVPDLGRGVRAFLGSAALGRTQALHNGEMSPVADLHLNDFLKWGGGWYLLSGCSPALFLHHSANKIFLHFTSGSQDAVVKPFSGGDASVWLEVPVWFRTLCWGGWRGGAESLQGRGARQAALVALPTVTHLVWQNEGVGAGEEIGMGAIKCLLSNYFSPGSSDLFHNCSIKLQPENRGEVHKTMVLLILSVCQCSDQALIPPSSCFFSCFCCSVPTTRTGGSTCHPSSGSLHSGPCPATFSCLDCFPIPCPFIDSGTPLCPHLTMWPRPVPIDGSGGGAAFAAILSHLPWPKKH